MSTFLERLEQEASELKTKNEALLSFIQSDKFNTVSEKQQVLLTEQLDAMHWYHMILVSRLEDLKAS